MGDLQLLAENSHLHGETIIRHDFPDEHDSLLDVLGSIPVPLRDFEPFTNTGRKDTPKRQNRRIGRSKRWVMLPIDQGALNKELKARFRADGWSSEPIAAGVAPGSVGSRLRGDFVRNRVFVEVEFGNTASMYRDLFKFQIANRARVGDVGVLILATKEMARFFDSGVATYEQAVADLGYMAIGMQMPVWIIGIEPRSFGAAGTRYEEMRATAEANSVECHTFAAFMGSPPLPSDELEDESSEDSDLES